MDENFTPPAVAFVEALEGYWGVRFPEPERSGYRPERGGSRGGGGGHVWAGCDIEGHRQSFDHGNHQRSTAQIGREATVRA